MNRFLCLAVLLSAFEVNAAETFGDIWDKCPGPACPGRTTKPRLDMDYETTVKEKELLERERELLEREKKLLERERRSRE